MQSQLVNPLPTMRQVVIACALGLVLGIISVWLPPYFVVIGIAGIAYLLIAWLWPEIALLGVLLATSTIFDIGTDILPAIPIGVGHILVSDILIFAMFGIILLRVMVNSTSYLFHTPLDVPLLAFYGTAILATIIGILNSTTGFNQSLDEVRIVNFFLTFFIVTNLVRNEKQLRRLYDGIILLAVFVAIAMIAQYSLGNGVHILPGRVETLTTAGSTANGVTRVLPPGQSLVLLGFVCLLVQFLFDRAPARFFIYVLQLGVLGLAVILTFNRSFWVAIALVLLLLGLLVSFRDKVRYIQIAFWATVIGAFLMAPLVIIKGPEVENLLNGISVRMSTLINPDTTQESSVVYRYIENQYAFPQIAAHPLFGLGLGADYRPRDRRLDGSIYNATPLTYYIHNGHLWVMLKTGLIGYLFFMMFLLIFVRRGYQNWKQIPDPVMKGIVLSFTAIIPGILVASIVDPIFKQAFWSPLIGIMLGMGEVIIQLHLNRTRNSLVIDQSNPA